MWINVNKRFTLKQYQKYCEVVFSFAGADLSIGEQMMMGLYASRGNYCTFGYAWCVEAGKERYKMEYQTLFTEN